MKIQCGMKATTEQFLTSSATCNSLGSTTAGTCSTSHCGASKQVTQNKGEKSGETCVPDAYKTWLSLQLLVKFGNITQTNRGKEEES